LPEASGGRLALFAAALALRPDGVFRVPGGGPAGLEDAEPGQCGGGHQRGAGQRRYGSAPAGQRRARQAGSGQRLNPARILPPGQAGEWPSRGFAAIRPATSLSTDAAAALPGLRLAWSSKHARNSAPNPSRG